MKRLLAVLALLFGGLSVEVVNPVNCMLITNSSSTRSRRLPEQDNGDD